MSSPFLQAFALGVIDRLVAAELIELGPAGQAAVAHHVATQLSTVQRGSLISSLVRALLACDDVEELWADDADLKAIVDDLSPGEAGLRRSS